MTVMSNSTLTSGGITLSSGDVLSNTSSGTITAPTYAVYAGTTASGVSVSNAGSIGGGTVTGGGGIKLADGGSVTNAASALVSGFLGINVLNASGSVVNAGTILGDTQQGLGVQLLAGGSVTNQSGGTISAEIGVFANVASASVSNYGQILGNDTIGPGVVLNAGGAVTNHTGGTISGQGGIQAQGSAAVVNDGLISAYAASSAGIKLNVGGSVTNQTNGVISGVHGVYIGGTGGSLVNAGLIDSTYGVSIHGTGTVVNAGSIAGSQDAVQLSAGYADLLRVDPGGSFSGRVDGGNVVGASVVSTIELTSGASTGTLSGLGIQFINFGQVTLDSGATWSFGGSNTLVDGATLSNAGTLMLTSADFVENGVLDGSGLLTIGVGSTLEATGTVGAGQTIAFASGSGALRIAPASFAATIDGLQPGGTIVLTGISDATSATVLPGNTLEVSRSGGPAIDLKLDPGQDFSGDQFHVGTSGGNAVLTESLPCYLAGTRIRTGHGEVPIEQLQVGDRVATRDGSAKPIRWIGRRSYTGAIPAGLRDVVPVSIAPGALADGVPMRELIVSPLHALYLDDVLVPAERLVNGRTIRRRPDIDPIRYFHIELERHDVIFAEGAPAESFVDCDSRTMFHNAAEYAALYPGEAVESWMFCAPRVESGAVLAAIRRRLDARAGLPPELEEAAPGPLLGRLDGIEAGRIAGWAFQPERPERPVWLEVLEGDGVIARVEARRYRADLEAAGIGDGRHGFELNLTGRLGEGRVIRVRRVADGAELDGSPLVPQPLDKLALVEEARRLIATATLDPADADALDGLTASLLQGIDVLHRVRARIAAPAGSGPRRGGARRALIIDTALPRVDRDAGSQAVLGHAAALLALGWQVEFVAPQGLADFAAEAAGLEEAGYVVHRAPQVASVEEVLRRHRNGFDLVYLHRLANAEAYAPLARLWQSRARLIYSLADLHHLRVARQAEVQSCEELTATAAALRVREINAMRLADAVITHSTAEAAYLAELAPGAAVHVVPWVPLTRPSPVPFPARQGVACIGCWTHEPNVDAVRWLVSAIMPAVWQRLPRVELLVVGSAWPQPVAWIADPRVRVVGQVGSLDPVLSMVRLTVAPLRFGAGLKGKVLDSLAACVPAVMTPLAAEGFALEGAALDLVAEDAEGLAALIVRAHEDAALNRAAAGAGRRLVEARFSPQAVQDALACAVARPGTTLAGTVAARAVSVAARTVTVRAVPAGAVQVGTGPAGTVAAKSATAAGETLTSLSALGGGEGQGEVGASVPTP